MTEFSDEPFFKKSCFIHRVGVMLGWCACVVHSEDFKRPRAKWEERRSDLDSVTCAWMCACWEES